MSDAVKDFQDNILKEEEQAKERKELQAKELQIRQHNADLKLNHIHQTAQEIEKAQNTDYSKLSAGGIADLRKKNLEYIEAAKNGMVFINEVFNGKVPYFKKNLILALGKTGEGKSTAVANIVRATMAQINPATGQGRKVLVITNEEAEEDVYNRVVSLAKGWPYINHDQFTDEQVKTFDEFIDKVSRSGRLNVIGDSYEGNDGNTTSIEGIKAIFDNLIKNKIYYDVIIIDYYQNISTSKNNPDLNEFQVQAMLTNMLDQYKNIYPAPIVLMAQIKPNENEKEKKSPIRLRIEGTKKIINKATLVIEMVPDKTNLRTEWVIHKCRFGEAVGTSFFTGFDKGNFVRYDQAFIDRVIKMRMDRLRADNYKDQISGQPSVPMKDTK